MELNKKSANTSIQPTANNRFLVFIFVCGASTDAPRCVEEINEHKKAIRNLPSSVFTYFFDPLSSWFARE